jgi:hypothetical protein
MEVLLPLQVAGFPGSSILSAADSQSPFADNLLGPGFFLHGKTKK